MIHSHSVSAVMATMLNPEASEFRVTHLEMIKVRLKREEGLLAQIVGARKDFPVTRRPLSCRKTPSPPFQHS